MIARCVVALLLLATPFALAQQEGEKEDPTRPRFKREQGDPAQLKARITELLEAVKAGNNDKAREIVTGFIPDAKVAEDVLTEEGNKKLGEKLVAKTKELAEGDAKQIAERLALDPEQSAVTVFSATTEDLVSMDAETDAAQHFAGGLRKAAKYFKPRYKFYAVLMRKPEAEEGGVRLQVFVFSQGRFVLLGKVWRLEGEG